MQPEEINAESLLTLIADAKEKLQPFVSAPTPELGRWCGLCCNGGFHSEVYTTAWKLGGCEGVNNLIILAGLDKNEDGKITESEVQEYKDKAQKLVDATLNQSLNSGVVAALLLSVFLPMTIDPFGPVMSENFAFDYGFVVDALLIINHVLLQSVCSLALMTLILSSRIYTMLSYWCPSLEIQLWFLFDSSNWILMLVMLPIWIMWLTPISMVISAMAVSGWYGLISIVPSVFWYLFWYSFENQMHKVLLRLQLEAKRVCRGNML